VGSCSNISGVDINLGDVPVERLYEMPLSKNHSVQASVTL
jgi:hypothetical protein